MNPALLLPIILGSALGGASKLRNMQEQENLEAQKRRTQEMLAQVQTGQIPPEVMASITGQPQPTEAEAPSAPIPMVQSPVPVVPSSEIGRRPQPMSISGVTVGKDGGVSFSLKPDRAATDAEFLKLFSPSVKDKMSQGLSPAEAAQQTFFELVAKKATVPTPAVIEQLMPEWEDVYDQMFHRLTSSLIHDSNFRRAFRMTSGLDEKGQAFANALETAAMRLVGDEMNYMPEDIRKSMAEAGEPKLTPDVLEQLAANGVVPRFASPEHIQAAQSQVNMRAAQQAGALARERGYAQEEVEAGTFETRLKREEIEELVKTLAGETAKYQARLEQPISEQTAEEFQVSSATLLKDFLDMDLIPIPKAVVDVRVKVGNALDTLGLLENEFNRMHSLQLTFGDRLEAGIIYRRLRRGFLSILARNVGDEKGNLAQSDYDLAENLTAAPLTSLLIPGMKGVYSTQFKRIRTLLEGKIKLVEKSIQPMKAGGKKKRIIKFTIDPETGKPVRK